MREGYKEIRLGEIPESWEESSIDEIGEVTSSKRVHRSDYTSEGIPFFRGKEISQLSKGQKLNDIVYIKADSFSSLKNKFGAPVGGDILVTAVGTIGSTYLVKEVDEFYFKDGNLIWLRNIKKEINKDFLTHYIKSSIFQGLIDNVASGSSQKALTIVKFKPLKILVPPLPEQQKIASILSTVDEKIDIIDQRISQTQELKKGLMQKLLTKGIGHTKFKNSELGEIPESWEVVKLGDVLKKIVGGGTPSRDEASYWNGNIPWVTVKDMKMPILEDSEEYITVEGLNNSSANVIPAWTLITSTRMALGKAVFVTKDAAINQDLKALFPDNRLEKKFLFQWFFNNSDNILSLGSGSTVKGIRLEVLKSISFLLPPLPEQQKIATILSTVDDKLEVLVEKKSHYQELKKGLMQQLLTGKVRVKV